MGFWIFVYTKCLYVYKKSTGGKERPLRRRFLDPFDCRVFNVKQFNPKTRFVFFLKLKLKKSLLVYELTTLGFINAKLNWMMSQKSKLATWFGLLFYYLVLFHSVITEIKNRSDLILLLKLITYKQSSFISLFPSIFINLSKFVPVGRQLFITFA